MAATNDNGESGRLARARRLLTRVKIPGWLMLAYVFFQGVPDWKSRFDFWLETTKSMGGYLGSAATVLLAPYIGIVIAVAGLAWLGLAGERLPAIQPPRWVEPLSKIAFLGFLSLVVVTVGSGYFETRVRESAAERPAPYSPWELTYDQTLKLGAILDHTPKKFLVHVNSLEGSTQSQSFGLSLTKVFGAHFWPVTWQVDEGLRPDLIGVSISLPRDANIGNGLAPEVSAVIDMLHAIDIFIPPPGRNNRSVLEPGVGTSAFWIVVGNKP
jgi:hypothetical protein